MEKNNESKQHTQHHIYKLIITNPGLHSRELSRQLQIPYSTLQYHLKSLDKQGIIQRERTGKFLYCYGLETLSIDEKKILFVLRNNTSKRIILYLLQYGRASQSELARHLKKHPTTVEFHLKKLLEYDIVKLNDGTTDEQHQNDPSTIIHLHNSGNKRYYQLKDNGHIQNFMKKYKDLFS
jgi:predicted transcriptional regulator